MRCTRATTSSHDANREATGLSSEVKWVLLRDVVNPTAPARSASVNSRFITRRSRSVAGPSYARSPMAQIRSAECPIDCAELIPLGSESKTFRYSAKADHLQGTAL